MSCSCQRVDFVKGMGSSFADRTGEAKGWMDWIMPVLTISAPLWVPPLQGALGTNQPRPGATTNPTTTTTTSTTTPQSGISTNTMLIAGGIGVAALALVFLATRKRK